MTKPKMLAGDMVPVCRDCHNVLDNRRRKQAEHDRKKLLEMTATV